MVIDEAMRAFLERGCATIVGTVGPDGTPHAQRAWSCEVLGDASVRVLLDGSDATLRSHLVAGGRIAVTFAHVRTLRSVQIKGRVLSVEEEPTAADLARADHHTDVVVTDIQESDHYPRQLVERMIPPTYVAAVISVEELYDQTPGPAAGARVGAGGVP